MSRSTAREVLTALAHRGLVVRPPNRSATVTRFTAEEVYETFNIREVLEGLCFRLAVENEPPESWQDLVDLYRGRRCRTSSAGATTVRQLKTIDYLIQRVRAASGNRTLCAMLESIDARSRYIICRTLILRGRLGTGLAEVRGVIAAMRRGDAAEAERLRRENIRGQKDFFRRHQELILNRPRGCPPGRRGGLGRREGRSQCADAPRSSVSKPRRLPPGSLPVLLAARNEPSASRAPHRITPAEHRQTIEALKPPSANGQVSRSWR